MLDLKYPLEAHMRKSLKHGKKLSRQVVYDIAMCVTVVMDRNVPIRE